VATVMMSVINVIILTIFSWLCYNQKLDLVSIVGISVGLISVAILEYAGK